MYLLFLLIMAVYIPLDYMNQKNRENKQSDNK
jgi:hypothetical protein